MKTTTKTMKYAQQANKPDWYQSDDSKLYFASTSGSSPFNEWYEIRDHDQAVDYIEANFSSQSFIDNMVIHEGLLLYMTDTIINGDGEIVKIKPDAEVNDFQAAIDYESKF